MTATATHPKPKVIVADDERAIADTLKTILDNFGYDTRVAYSGETAVELLRDFQPDMLISEVIMPGISGIDAAIYARTTLPACKVLLISGNMATADLLDAARDQNHHFEVLAKPIHPTDLLNTMRSRMSA
ncbi:MAG: response regulator [Terracidiphilus sp.]